MPGLFRNNEMIILCSKLGRLYPEKKKSLAFITVLPLVFISDSFLD